MGLQMALSPRNGSQWPPVKLFTAYSMLVFCLRRACYVSSPAKERGGKQVGSDNMFSLKELSQVFASNQPLAALVGITAPARVAHMINANAFAAMSLNDNTDPALHEPALEPFQTCVAAFQN